MAGVSVSLSFRNHEWMSSTTSNYGSYPGRGSEDLNNKSHPDNVGDSFTLTGLGSELIQQQPCQRNCDIVQHKEILTALPPFVPRDRLLLEVDIM
ncbi:hypothetical protein DUI87_07929 [Hirundo rustica rustica]|uniref:Uncharacterized protein n=1 Tax=Hirundo rustica rustica TaxID=333673 RepID=A0A3M0KS25_HIRRU|nr:hypothetical protein DUI87_07929 [Hirundo rustica rustica]